MLKGSYKGYDYEIDWADYKIKGLYSFSAYTSNRLLDLDNAFLTELEDGLLYDEKVKE